MASRLTLLAIFAHPDDETYRCGGTLALLARLGVRVQVLTATRGEAGSRGEPSLCQPEELPFVRENELRCACRTLGIDSPLLLDYPDGRLTEVNPRVIVPQILTVVMEIRPQVILSYGSDGVSGHPDHVAIGQFAAGAFHQAKDVERLYTLAVPCSLVLSLGLNQLRGIPDDQITWAVDISETWEAKMAAIRCHATQTGSSPMLRASEENKHAFFGFEHFVLAGWRNEIDSGR
jgi:LmbE family N-acetylglucosaminyl deacetylase